VYSAMHGYMIPFMDEEDANSAALYEKILGELREENGYVAWDGLPCSLPLYCGSCFLWRTADVFPLGMSPVLYGSVGQALGALATLPPSLPTPFPHPHHPRFFPRCTRRPLVVGTTRRRLPARSDCSARCFPNWTCAPTMRCCDVRAQGWLTHVHT
jgi:hypothetical protein